MKNIVEEVMTTNLITIRPHDLVTRVAEIFSTHSFHHIPIVNEENCIEGIISRIDFERIKNGKTLFRNPNIEKYNELLFESLLAKDIMTEGVVHLRPKDPVEKAYNIFKENKIRALPILEKGKLIGLITPLDILDFFFNLNKNQWEISESEK